jgi:hypothetical protein
VRLFFYKLHLSLFENALLLFPERVIPLPTKEEYYSFVRAIGVNGASKVK